MIAISHARLGQCEKSNRMSLDEMALVSIFELPISTPGSAGVTFFVVFFTSKRFHWFFANITYLVLSQRSLFNFILWKTLILKTNKYVNGIDIYVLE